MALTGQRIGTSKIVSGVSPTRNSKWWPKSDIVVQQVQGERAMSDFLIGASWGAWFFLAAITAAGLFAIIH